MTQSRTNPAALDMLIRSGGVKLLSGMISAFEESGPERLVRARSALEKHDAATLAAAAHSLKSSAGQLGAVTLQRLSTEIEELALASKVKDAVPLLAVAEAELQYALGWMKEYSENQ
jgi:FOG: HPt domain